MAEVDFDVLVIGAGVAGINAAFRLQELCPDKTYTLIEARGAIGGTWDLFRYPGIRSDSDLHTFGFPWRPWRSPNTIAEGRFIREYVAESAAEYGIDKNIQFHTKLLAANWDSAAQVWTSQIEANGQKKTLKTRFMIHGTGYYDYHAPLEAQIPGLDKFEGQVIHPQFWPEDLDYSGKNIVIIGSGATAITLLPNLADKAEHVTMLQRSPSYIMSLPRADPSAEFLKKILPLSWAYYLIRLKFLVLPLLFYKFCRAYPGPARKVLQRGAARDLPKGYALDPNFNPAYGPWEQRLCVSPGGDFYKAISTPKADVITAHIDRIAEKSIVLKNNDQILRPDIIVTATGLKVAMLGGAKISVDGEPVVIDQKFVWKGCMLSGVPNAAVLIGYTNASWTLGADATSQLMCRMLNQMSKNGFTSATPTLDPTSNMQRQLILNLNSTYIVKASGEMPNAGDRAPWLPRTTYFTDIKEARSGDLTADMVFT